MRHLHNNHKVLISYHGRSYNWVIKQRSNVFTNAFLIFGLGPNKRIMAAAKPNLNPKGFCRCIEPIEINL